MVRPSVVVAVAALVVAAGCGGPGDRTPVPIEGEASAATVGEDALGAVGYEPLASGTERVNRTGTVDVSGDVELTVSYRVRATAARAAYGPTGGPVRFALLVVPLVSPEDVAVTIDPLGDRDPAAVVERALGRSVGGLQPAADETVTLLGTETTLREYTATVDGAEVTVAVARVEHDGDAVRAVAVVGDGEGLRRLLAAVDHDGG